MERLQIVVSLSNDNAYQDEQGLVAKATADSLGLDLRVMHAQDDAITPSQQLFEIIQSSSLAQPDAFFVEPVTNGASPRR
jgi:hypothetical protein